MRNLYWHQVGFGTHKSGGSATNLGCEERVEIKEKLVTSSLALPALRFLRFLHSRRSNRGRFQFAALRKQFLPQFEFSQIETMHLKFIGEAVG